MSKKKKEVQQETSGFSEEFKDWFFSPLTDDEYEKNLEYEDLVRKHNLKSYHKKKGEKNETKRP